MFKVTGRLQRAGARNCEDGSWLWVLTEKHPAFLGTGGSSVPLLSPHFDLESACGSCVSPSTQASYSSVVFAFIYPHSNTVNKKEPSRYHKGLSFFCLFLRCHLWPWKCRYYMYLKQAFRTRRAVTSFSFRGSWVERSRVEQLHFRMELAQPHAHLELTWMIFHVLISLW